MAGNPNADDYYEVLGVGRDANENDIKKAYKKAALRHHPDKNPDDREGAEARFKNVSEAYEALVDPEKRAAYDQYGKAAFQAGGMGSAGSGSFRGEGMDPRDFFSQHGGHTFSFGFGGRPGGGNFRFRNANDIFAEFFGSSDPFSVFDDDPFFNNSGSLRNRMQQDMGMGGMGGFPGMSSGFSMSFGGPGGIQSSSFSSSSSSQTRGGVSKSVKTSTVVRDGKRIIKTTTTTRDAQGNVSTRTEEREEDASMGGGMFLGQGNGRSGLSLGFGW
jgi:curved DNA-binding protein CbpA